MYISNDAICNSTSGSHFFQSRKWKGVQDILSKIALRSTPFLRMVGPGTKTAFDTGKDLPLTPPIQLVGRWGGERLTREVWSGRGAQGPSPGRRGELPLESKALGFVVSGRGSGLTFARLRRLVRRPSGVSAIPVSMGVADPGKTVGPA